MPPLIHDLLTSQVSVIFARVVLTAFFWIAGLFGLFKFGVMVKVIEERELPAPRLIVALMVLTELVGSALAGWVSLPFCRSRSAIHSGNIGLRRRWRSFRPRSSISPLSAASCARPF